MQSTPKLHYIHVRNDKILEKLIGQAKWIKSKYNNTDVCPVFSRDFTIDKKAVKSELSVTAMCIYEARLNGCRLGDFFMAPGWTQYEKRHQYQTYDVTKNLRTAKQHIKYICKDGYQTYRPHFTFMGFRYIRLEKMPKGMNDKNFKTVAVYSDMERTGYFKCSETKLNKLYENVIWGQKSNFIDVPTDCPQRDERLGWTGDAQMFVKTAAYNFNVNKFYAKWLRDVYAAREDGGGIPVVVSAIICTYSLSPGAAWGDAAVICPWQLYLAYGDKTLLSQQLASMEKWIKYTHGHGNGEFLWRGD